MKEKYNVSWEEFGDNVTQLAIKIEGSNKTYNGIYGVPRGGLPTATALSYYLNVPLVFDIDKADLIVDDISDSGSTFKKLIKDRDVDTATMFISKDTQYMPTYYYDHNHGLWINFPYEYYGREDSLSIIKNS